MIRSVRHKGLAALYNSGQTRGVQQSQVKRLRSILHFLDTAVTPEDMNLPGLRLHPLRGNMQGYWSVSVSGNWRVIFRFDGGHVKDVDLVDYH